MIEIEQQYRIMFENMVQGAFFKNADGSVVAVNSAALKMLGVTHDQFMGSTAYDLSWQVIQEDGSVLVPEQFPSVLALQTGLPVYNFIAGVFNPQFGKIVWISVNAIPLIREGCLQPYQVLVTLHDISEQKRMNDLLVARLHLKRFAATHSLSEILVETLDNLEVLTGSSIGFYHFYDAEQQSIILQEWSTQTLTRFCKVGDIDRHYDLDKAGVWAECIRSGTPVIHNDYESLSQRKGLPQGHAAIVRELVVPVKRQDRILAVLGVGNKAQDYNQSDLETVMVFADLAWDIAEAKRIELQQQQTLLKYEVMTQTSMDGVWVVDSAGRILFANDTLCRLYGYTQEEILTKSIGDLEAIEDDNQILKHQQLIEARGYDRFESQHRARDGRVIDVEINVAYVPSDKTCMAFVRDISSRRQAEQVLGESEAKFRSLFESSPDAIMLSIPDGRITACNSAACHMFDRSEAEICKVGRAGILDISDPRLAVGLNERQKTGKVQGWELTSIRRNGEKFAVEIDSVILDEESGRSFVVIRDITQRKQAEEEKTNLENQLHQAQKIESIGHLAGGVAHDFNNMLGVILGHAELAIRKADRGQPVIGDLGEIRKAANRSAELTRQLLTFARKQNITPKVLDLNEIVAGMLKMLQRLIGENIQLAWSPAETLWPVKVDPSQVDQILVNLCVNARDAIEGPGHIMIKVGNSSFDDKFSKSRPYALQAGDYVQLSVSDDGCGMDKEIQAHIFEPFYTTKKVGTGTGLGLATIYGAVKQNGGFITVSSEEGKGTTINIYFPRDMTAVACLPDKQTVSNLTGTETILLVEDDNMLLKLETAMLEEMGYQVLAAVSTDKAISFAQNHPTPIHLLISDMIMPVMNGRELAAKILPLRPAMKVLFMSGYTADIISKQGIVEERIHFLQKPASFEIMRTKVREVLDES